jgi:hypothetical protein
MESRHLPLDDKEFVQNLFKADSQNTEIFLFMLVS